MTPLTASTIRFHEYGEPLDVLREETTEISDPGPARVRVRVSAVGLNPADWELCRGFMPGTLPRGIGFDVAGVVDAIGEGVSDVAVGDAVFGSADFAGEPSAGAAEAAILDRWYPMPRGLSPVAAATLPMVMLTAVWTLDAMGVGEGSTLLVNGAGGMVGFVAVQLARRRGARVIAAAGPTFAAELESFGATVTPYGQGLAGRVRELAGGPVDLVLDASRPQAGTIVELTGAVERPDRVTTISNHDEARAAGAQVNLDHLADAAAPQSFLPGAASLAADGELRIPVAGAFPLARWREAVSLSLSGHPHGKVVLLPGEARVTPVRR